MTHEKWEPLDLEWPHVCAAAVIAALVFSVAAVALILTLALAP